MKKVCPFNNAPLKPVFYISGSHQYHMTLTFTPHARNSVSCNSQYIYIIQEDPPLLSVYTWAATHLCDADQNELRLTGHGKTLFAVGSVGPNSIVLAVSSDEGWITSLVVYDVK